MRFVVHKSNNCVLSAPNSMTIDECGALPVTKTIYKMSETEEYIPEFRSFWEPSAKEIELIKQGKKIILSVLSNIHPPVSISVEE